MAKDYANKEQNFIDEMTLKSVYKNKSKAKYKYLPILAISIILIIAISSLANISPKEKAEASTFKKKSSKDTETNIEITPSEDESEQCSLSDPKFGGINSKSCSGDDYQKTYECFESSEEIDGIIHEFQLSDETYMVYNIAYREGPSKDKYRIMAVFKDTKCLVNITSSIESKESIIKAFEDERFKLLELNS